MRKAKEQKSRKRKSIATSDAQGLLCKQFSPSNSEDKDALIKAIQRYYYHYPHGFKKIATKIQSISASTLWRIVTDREKNPHPRTLYHLFHFLEQERWIKVFESERKLGSIIDYSIKKVKGWLGINSYKFKG